MTVRRQVNVHLAFHTILKAFFKLVILRPLHRIILPEQVTHVHFILLELTLFQPCVLQ